jgi:hypothetical protein
MSFKKNLLSLVTVILLVFICAFLAKLDTYDLVVGLTFGVAFGITFLSVEDLWRKVFSDKKLITWQYSLGVVIVLTSVFAFFMASQGTTFLEVAMWLGAVFSIAVLGSVWFNTKYKKSITNPEELYQNHWHKISKKAKKFSQEEAKKLLYNTLRYHIIGDTLDGDMDITRPLVEKNGKHLTYAELSAMELSSSDITLQIAIQSYIEKLTMSLT